MALNLTFWRKAFVVFAIAVLVAPLMFTASSSQAAVFVAQPTVETQTFSSSGDIADDSAIWVNPADPAQSLVVAGNKADSGGGIGIFDMAGNMVHYSNIGKIGNVDLRNNIMVGGQPITLVTANRRDNNSLLFYKLDPATRTLVSMNARTITTMANNYGVCFYKSPTALYANVTSESGAFQQWELFESSGKIDANLVRTFAIGSISEGCVADDDRGQLYISEEQRALWKYSAEPTGGNSRTAVGSAGDGNLVSDIEGVTIAYGPNGTGQIIVSSQGNSTFIVYDRITNAYVKTFSVGSNDTIDSAENTDGVDVTTANLGGAFAGGMLVVHDEFNSGSGTSNLKYVPLSQILAAPGESPTPTPVPTPSNPTSTTLNLTPVADAAVRSDRSSTNLGSATALEVDASPASRSLMKFNVTGIGTGTVTSVKLRLYTVNASSHGGNVHRVTNTSWAENSVTWSNAPAADPGAITSIPAVSIGNWVEVNVPGVIAQDGTYTLSLEGISTDGADYSSKEASSNRPTLVIAVNSGTATPTPTVSPTFTPSPTPLPSPTPTPTPTVTPASSTLSFVPSADARVLSGSPSTNYGASSTLEVDASPAIRTLMKFNITGIGTGTVTSVKLRLYTTNASPHGGNVHRVSNTTWAENTITWSNAPAAVTGALVSIPAVKAGSWVEVSVPGAISQDGVYTLSLEGVNSNGADYSSKEASSNRPALIVSVSNSSATPSPTPTASPTPAPSPTPTPTPSPSTTPLPTSGSVSIAAVGDMNPMSNVSTTSNSGKMPPALRPP